MQDIRASEDPLDEEITRRLPPHTPVLNVFNKLDLAIQKPSSSDTRLYISAKSGEGLNELRQRLLDIAGWKPTSESPWLARERHIKALRSAAEHLDLAARHAQHSDSVLDLFAEELRLAHEDLCSITGQFTSDDLLGEIFSSFCIGK